MIIGSHYVNPSTTIYIHDTLDAAYRAESTTTTDLHVCLDDTDNEVLCENLDCCNCPLTCCESSGIISYLQAENSPILQSNPEIFL